MNYENFVKAVEGLADKYQKMNPDRCMNVISTPSGLVITHGIRTELRKDWIDEMLTEYNEEYEDWSKVILHDENRKVMVVHFADRWGDREGYGISKCSPTDQFDEEVGLAVAFAHFRGYPIPDFI